MNEEGHEARDSIAFKLGKLNWLSGLGLRNWGGWEVKEKEGLHYNSKCVSQLLLQRSSSSGSNIMNCGGEVRKSYKSSPLQRSRL